MFKFLGSQLKAYKNASTSKLSYSTVVNKTPKINVMEHVSKQLVEKANIDGRRELFSRNNPNGIKPGSIVMGIDTNFTLRNIVMRVGVEQRYNLYSPLLKSIKVMQKPNEVKFRRAKLYYLRDQPGKAFQSLQGLWKQEQLDKAKK
ncbi:unnamed protein product [Rhizopus microsporus]